jgi:hypothetical protein
MYLFFTILYLLFLVTIVILADLNIGAWVFTAARLVPFGDKLCHLILMGIFSFLLNTALGCRIVLVGRVRMLLGSLIAYSLVLAEEFSQVLMASRTLEAYDMLFDMLGIYLFGLLAHINLSKNPTTIRSRRRAKARP